MSPTSSPKSAMGVGLERQLLRPHPFLLLLAALSDVFDCEQEGEAVLVGVEQCNLAVNLS